MRIVYRYRLADDVAQSDRRDVLLSAYGTLRGNVLFERGRNPQMARRYAGMCRDMLAAFGVRAEKPFVIEV